MKHKEILFLFIFIGWVNILFSQNSHIKKSELTTQRTYEANWTSLTKHPYPEWFQDAKFGIYFHWGVYSVPAYGNEWYPRWMYIDTLVWGTQFYEHHVKTYGKPDKFGYKDFIPMFKAEKFDADEWADLFSRSGAKFAGPVAEHADGFSMWDSRLNPWNAKNMGPKRDIVGELETAIRKKGMKFIATFHHQWEWGWYPTWDTLTDCYNPEYAGFYGPKTLPGAFDYTNPNPAPGLDWFQLWKNKTIEVISKYKPDMIWFDSRLSIIPDSIKRNLLAYYYNKGLLWNREVSMTYKVGELPVNSAILDIEKGALDDIQEYPWLTDASIDDASWCYNLNPKYKTSQRLIDYLITIVSKNGQLLLDIPPKPDGTIPDEVKSVLLDMGGWLAVNGEAIYGTRPWIRFGEGPTPDGKGDFNDKIPDYTPKDIRFTTKGDTLYCLVMAIPEDRKIQIASLTGKNFSMNYIELVGTSKKLKYIQNSEGIIVELPKTLPSGFALAIRIVGLKNEDSFSSVK
jgi:alpha-L-fucosidase